MRNILLIAAREAHALFATPTAWGLATFYQLLGGLLFCRIMLVAQYADLTGFYGLLGGLLVLVVPIVAMGRIAGERRAGTMELLATSPVSTWQLVCGKWLALVAFVGLLTVLSLQYPLILAAYENPDIGQWGPATVALLAMGALLAAVGLFASSLTSNTVLAGIGALGLSLFLWWFHSLGAILGEGTALFEGASLYHRTSSMCRGVVDSCDVAYFAFATYFFLSLAARGVESDRW